ncbi:MAG: putative sulfate exporter family transporter [Trueperaceae bacterium]
MSVSAVARLLPGLLLVAALAAAAFAVARLPGAQLLGPLVLALLLGVALRAAVRRPLPATAAGVAFSGRTLLRLGIVLLGVRLDARALVELGPWVLVGSAVGAVVAFAAIELAGRAWRVPTDLRRLVGIGTAICGASAIAAALPLVRRAPGEPATPGGPAPVAIAAISLLGTAGVLGFVTVDAVATWPAALLAALAGATLQEVGQAVAAGATVGGEHAQLALLVKLSRVVWLAPALLALGWWARRTASADGSPSPDGLPSDEDAAALRRRARPPLVPGFVLGFLAFGLATSLGVVPPDWVAGIALAGTALTAAAMAAIGMGVDASAIGRSGRQALGLGAVGFAALTLVMVGWYVVLLG